MERKTRQTHLHIENHLIFHVHNIHTGIIKRNTQI